MQIIIERTKRSKVPVRIQGVSTLIQNHFPEWRKMEILKEQTDGKSTKGKKLRDPEQEYADALYPKVNGNFVHPGIAIKRAVVGAAKTYVPKIDKKQANGAFYVPEWIPIFGDGPEITIDRTMLKGSILNIAIRAKFVRWNSEFEIEYDERGILTIDQIINLIDIAGYSIGIGQHRPERGGIFGRFEVVTQEVQKTK